MIRILYIPNTPNAADWPSWMVDEARRPVFLPLPPKDEMDDTAMANKIIRGHKIKIFYGSDWDEQC